MQKSTNELQEYFLLNNSHLLHKWHHCFDIYDRHFRRFKNTEVHVVEIGVYQGGSLDMWRRYFGEQCHVYGIDINPHCEKFGQERTRIFIGDAGSRQFLRQLKNNIPRIDILIDDGGHRMHQQRRVFEELFPCISENGVYLCEDLCTSYWLPWRLASMGRGGILPMSFVDYSKRLIDRLNGWHTQKWYANPLSPGVSEFTRTVDSMHYYDNMLVIEKGAHPQPFHSMIGKATIPEFKSWYVRLLEKFIRV